MDYIQTMAEKKLVTKLDLQDAPKVPWDERLNIKIYKDITGLKPNSQQTQDALKELKDRFDALLSSHLFDAFEPTVTIGRSDGKIVMALQSTVKLTPTE